MIDEDDAFGGTIAFARFIAEPEKLRDRLYIRTFLKDLVAKIGMQAVSLPEIYEIREKLVEQGKEFIDDGGITAMLVGNVVLSTSHCAIHTWPQQGKATAMCYSCKAFAPEKLSLAINFWFAPEKLLLSDLSREAFIDSNPNTRHPSTM